MGADDEGTSRGEIRLSKQMVLDASSRHRRRDSDLYDIRYGGVVHLHQGEADCEARRARRIFGSYKGQGVHECCCVYMVATKGLERLTCRCGGRYEERG